MALETKPPLAWIEHQASLLSLARRQLFLVGGPPRSGTTWLQYLLDSHPEVCCRGEGLFMRLLADPIDRLMAQQQRELQEKNKVVFRHAEGYPLPRPEETEHLLGTAVLLALERQCAGKDYRAIGEKTPENVFFFRRMKHLFPHVKIICIVRDPRDLLASAWHYFHKSRTSGDAAPAKVTFLRNALPGINSGSRAILELTEQYQSDCIVVTYERMVEATEAVAAELFRFLGVSDSVSVVARFGRADVFRLADRRPLGRCHRKRVILPQGCSWRLAVHVHVRDESNNTERARMDVPNFWLGTLIVALRTGGALNKRRIAGGESYIAQQRALVAGRESLGQSAAHAKYFWQGPVAASRAAG